MAARSDVTALTILLFIAVAAAGGFLGQLAFAEFTERRRRMPGGA